MPSPRMYYGKAQRLEELGAIIGSLLDAWMAVRVQMKDEMGEDGEHLAKWLDDLNRYMETGEMPEPLRNTSCK